MNGDPATPSEALRKEAWLILEDANRSWAHYEDALRAHDKHGIDVSGTSATTQNAIACRMIYEAERLDALAGSGLSAEHAVLLARTVEDAVTVFSDSDVERDVEPDKLIAALHAAGFVVGRVRT